MVIHQGVIHQGDVFWLDLGRAAGSGPAYRHPVAVVQTNAFNDSRINTVIVCAITSNLRRAQSPGNVALRQGEAQLPKRSVVNVTQLVTVDKAALVERIGALSKGRMREVLDGIALVLAPTP